ncbi:reverse transcriptase domain-containing protein [Tanacetum coccineum]
MRTRSSSNLIVESSTIPKRRNRRHSKQIVEPELRTIVETPVDTMADTRSMSELLQAPTEGYGDAIVIPTILAENFELKFGLLQLVTSSQFHAAGCNLLNRTPRDALTIIENKSKVRTSRNKPVVSKASTCSTPTYLPEITALTDACLATDGNTFNASAATWTYNQGGPGYRPQGETNYRANNQMRPPGFPQPNVQNNQNRYNQNQGYNQNHFNQGNKNYQAPLNQTQMQSPSGSGSLPSNTIANPRGDLKAITTRSGVSYDGPTIPPTSSPLSKEVPHTSNLRLSKFLFQSPILHFDLSFADALLHMPKFASTFKSLLSNKEKLFELANTPLNENCLAMLLKKLPKKLRDPGKFIIPCDFSELDECLALANLGASINLMPLSVWKKISLPELTPTCMTLELANRSVTYPVGVAEDVFVKVGKFHFLADFVVVDYDVDPRVPLILGRPFLRTTRALIDVHDKELTLRFNDEAITFKIGHTLRYSYRYDDESVNRIDVIDVTCEEYAQEVLGFLDSSKSGNPTPSLDPIITTSSPSLTPFEGGDFVLEEIEACLTSDTILLGINDDDFDPEGDILILEKVIKCIDP